MIPIADPTAVQYDWLKIQYKWWTGEERVPDIILPMGADVKVSHFRPTSNSRNISQLNKNQKK